MKVHAIIERASDGSYSIYTKEDFEDFVLIAAGKTPEEAIKDLDSVAEEMKPDFPILSEIEFEYSYDVASFLRDFKNEFSMSGLEVITGINQKQLHHYLTGHRKPSEKTVRKIQNGIMAFASRLNSIHLV